MKKLSRGILVALALLLAVSLPTLSRGMIADVAAADYGASRSSGLTPQDVELAYISAAINSCENDIYANYFSNDGSVNLAAGSSLSDKIAQLQRYLDFDFGVSSKTLLYDAYMEERETGKYDDGKLWCSEVKDMVRRGMRLVGIDTPEIRNDMICGSNGRDGLYTIRMGYLDTSGMWYNSKNGNLQVGSFPVTDKNGYLQSKNDCLDVLDDLRLHMNSGLAMEKMDIKQYDSSNNLTTLEDKQPAFQFNMNDDYDLYGRIFNGVTIPLIPTNETKLHALLTACVSVRYDSDAEYLQQESVSTSQKKINRLYYNNSDFPGNAQEYYYELVSNPNKKIYMRNVSSLTTKNEATCQEISDALKADGATKELHDAGTVEEEKRRTCEGYFDTDRSVIMRFINNVSLISRRLNELADTAISLGSGEGTTLPFDYRNWHDYISPVEKAFEEISKADTSGNNERKITVGSGMRDATSRLIEEAKEWIDDITDVYARINGINGTSAPSAEKLATVKGWGETFKNNMSEYDGTYTDKLNAIRVPDKNKPTYISGNYVTAKDSSVYYDDSIGDCKNPMFNWDEINNITGGSVTIVDYVLPDFTPDVDDQSEYIDRVGDSDQCFAGAGSLGWILCPISSALANSLDHIYENVVEDFLVVDARMFADDNGAHEAWGIFVNIANVLMVIFLLVIVFSQLTGVGIDNYGIKKALPKIIIGAILINLSYVICQALVDISNIVGDSVNNLLASIGEGLPMNAAGFSEGTDRSALFSTLIGSTLLTAGAAAGLSIYASVIETGGFFGVFVPILIAALGALISVLFFFIILGIRQVAVILLVVLSPLAFVCYMLPNTKSMFDRWKKLFKAMLLVYPIAGFTVGGGFLATRILMSTGAGGSDNAFMMLTYIVTMVYPFFLVPTMVSKSMGALGDITSRLSNFGRGLRQRTANGLNRGIQSTARYQAARQEAAERQKYRVGRAANRLARRNEDRLNERALERAARGRKLSASDQARLDRYRRTQADWTTDREATGDRVSDGSFYAGYANQRRSESSSKNKDTRQWADSRYVSAQEKKADTRRRMDYGETMQWNYDGIAQAALDDNRNKLNERMARARAGVVVKNQDVLRRQAESQRNLDLANNDLNVTPEITPEYAQSLAKGRFDTAQQKMYAESFKNLTRAQSEIKLNNLLKGDKSEIEFKNDTNYLEALISDLRGKGGSVEVAKALMNNMSAPTANSTKEEMDYYKTLTSIAATMSDQPIVKQWGKYAQDVMQRMVIENGVTKSATPVSLETWIQNGDERMLFNIDGSTFKLDSQKQSLENYLTENPKITAGMDKDQLDLLSTIYGNNPKVLADGRSAIYASLGASTAEERKKSEGVISTYVKNKIPDERADDLANIPISDFVKMEPEIFARLVYGDVNGNMNNVVANSKMEQMLRRKAEQIGQAGGNVLASLSPEIRDALEKRFGPLGSLSSGTPKGQPQGGNSNPTINPEDFGADFGL